jgi:hypothetical protein
LLNKLLIFLDSGLLLFKKNFDHSINNDQADLVTGFFSAIFHYFADQDLGTIKVIKTENKIILIQKIHQVYISIFISLFHEEIMQENIATEELWYYNKQIEEISTNLLKILERKMAIHLSNNSILKDERCPDKLLFFKIELEINEIIKSYYEKIEIIHSIIKKKRKSINQIYKNV